MKQSTYVNYATCIRSIFAACFVLLSCALSGQLPNIGLLANINPTATSSSSPSNLIKLGTNMIFSASDGTNGTELWKSDGTPAGTALVKDIRPGSASSSPNNFEVMGGFVYFTANDGTNGGALWRTDGTTAGTTLVKDVHTGSTTSASFISELTAIDGKLYFRGFDPTNGEEPWISDGTPGGTTILKNIKPGSASSSSNNTGSELTGCFGTFEFVKFGGFVYFNGNDGANGGQNSELWRTDGTTAGTNLFIDNYTFGGGGPGNLVDAGSYLFFTSDNQSNTGAEPWKTDGTVAGTVMIKDIFNPGFNVGSITGDVPTIYMNGFVYFVAVDVYAPGNFNLMPPQNGYVNAELWRTDGTAVGTTKVKEINPATSGLDADVNSNPNNFYVYNNKLYFTATDGTNGTEPWVTDGTAANTIMLKNIDAAGNSNPSGYTQLGGFVYFRADDNAANGTEIWRTDGTTTNTVLVKDINPGASNSSPSGFAALDANHMLFAATHIVTGSELFILGGYKVEVTTGANGITNLPGAGSASTTVDVGVKSGASATFTFTPDPMNSVQSLTIDGTPSGAPTSYTFSNVTANHTLAVTFGSGAPQCPTFSGAPANVTITNSTCNSSCVAVGGVITAVPGTPCPTGSTLQYQVNDGAWTTSAPTYNQAGPIQSIKTRCNCDINTALSSAESAAAVTVPANCADTQVPSISCPANTTIAANASCQAQLGSYSATSVSDNCSTSPSVSQSPSSSTLLNGHNAQQTVTLTATDGAGNTATCSFSVTLKDVTPPSITCPGNTTISANASCQGQIGSYSAASSGDNCNANPTVTQNPSSTTVLTGHNATQSVTLTANDGNGNTANCSFSVTLKDATAPSITCPGNTTISADASCQGQLGSYNAVSLSDNCNASPTVSQSPASTTTLTGHNASQTVTLTASDGNGNTSTCTFSVTLKDATAPSITCPGNTTVAADGSCQGQVGSYTATSLSDNCNPNPTFSQIPASATVLNGHNASQSVTLTADDGNGNTANCSFSVTLKDVTVPTITCPANTTVSANASCQGQIGSYSAATLSDNCNASPTVSQSPASSTVLTGHNATQSVTLTANDGHGNTANCSFSVTLKDVTPPTALCKNITLSLSNAGTASTNAAAVNNGSSDNCSSVSISLSKTSFDCTNLGANLVTLTVTDILGNLSTCSATVTVGYAQLPVAKCRTAVVVLSSAGNGSVSPAGINNNSTDICGIASLAVSKSTFNCSNIGVNVITLTVTNNGGNTSTCTATVTVKDITKPMAKCKNASYTLASNGSIVVPTADINNVSTDACTNPPNLSLSPNTFTCANIGANIVTLTATDGSNNNGTCTAVVTIACNGAAQQPTAGAEAQLSELLDLFPNPTSDKVNIRLKNVLTAPATLSVLDYTGKVVYWSTMAEGASQITIDLLQTRITSGVYIVSLKQENSTQTKQMVVFRD